MDTYADDLALLIDKLGLERMVLIGFSTGGGEVARYIGRHGTRRVAKVALVSAVPPLMLKTERNPEGLPLDVFDRFRHCLLVDRAQFFHDFTAPFYGANRPGKKVSPGTRDAFWLQAMQAGLRNAFECIQAFSETDFTDDLAKIDVPTLVVHGDDDQIVPIAASAYASAQLIRNAMLKVYPGAPHGLTDTHKERLNRDLLEFVSG